MKRIQLILLILALLFIVLHARSQSPGNSRFVGDSIRYAESIWAMKKKGIVLAEMNLSEAEKSSFWPVYESYYRATQFLEMEYIQLLAEFHDKLSAHDIEQLSLRALQNDLLMAKIRKLYFKKFKRALNPRQASQFMELDNNFRLLLRAEMKKDIPPIDGWQLQAFSQSPH